MENQIRKIGNEEIVVRRELDVEQRALMATQMAQLHQELDEMVEQRKSAVKSFKEDETTLKRQINNIYSQINDGVHEERVTALLTVDYEKKKRIYLDLNTNEVLRESPMTSEDYQFMLNLGGEDLRKQPDDRDMANGQPVSDYPVGQDEAYPIPTEEAPVIIDNENVQEYNTFPAADLPGTSGEAFEMNFVNDEMQIDPVPAEGSDVDLPTMEEASNGKPKKRR